MPDRPNVLLITTDQQIFDTLGFKNPKIKTPNLDRLAAEGVDFTRAYCPSPVCSPSRSSIITGLYPHAHHCWTIGVKLPEDVPTVGETFHEHGYATSLIGKAHFQPLASDPDGPGGESIECQPILRDLDFWRNFNETHTPWYGFDHVELARNHADESHAGQHYAIWMEEKGLKDWRDYFQPLPGEDRGPDCKAPVAEAGHGYGGRDDMHWKLPQEYHFTTWTGERTCAEIEKQHNSDTPFFCWSSFHDPHPPYVVPEPWASMYDPKDMEVGELVEGELEKMPPPHQMTRQKDVDWKQFVDTGHGNHGYGNHVCSKEELQACQAIYYGMVSFIDDQVGRILDKLDDLGIADNTIVVFTTDHGHFIGQHGLNAKGAFHYEHLIKLPFIVRYPKEVPAGRSSDAIQSLVDLAPTFLDYCGIEIPGIMQGVSQRQTWNNPNDAKKKARDWAICEMRHQYEAVHLRTFVNDRYKLTLYRDRDWGELFDLQEDPDEINNVFDDPAYAEVRCEVMRAFVNAEIEREMTRMPRICGA